MCIENRATSISPLPRRPVIVKPIEDAPIDLIFARLKRANLNCLCRYLERPGESIVTSVIAIRFLVPAAESIAVSVPVRVAVTVL